MNFDSLRFTSLAAALLALSSCAVGPDYHRPQTPVPDAYLHGEMWKTAAPADTLDRGDWWTLFGDTTLNDLETRIDRANQTVAGAAAAYAQARALVREQRASFFPDLTADASVDKTHSQSSQIVTTQTGSGVRSSSPGTIYRAEVGASWELDVFGRIRREVESAGDAAQASAADLAAARLAAQGELASDYFQLRETDAEQALLRDTVEGYKRSLQITQNRYDAKVAAKSDVLQAQTQLFNAQADLADLTRQRAVLENAIAVLVGEPAGQFALPGTDWVANVPDVPLSIPSELLQRRPDVASAERRMASANAQIGVAKAAYFPTFNLNAAYGSSGSAIGDLLDTSARTWSLGGTIAATIFDFGATRARTAQARAAYDQNVASYRQTALSAFQDVGNQLATSQVLEQQTDLRQRASDAADEAERIALNQYRSGLISYTDVVTSQTAALNARRSLVQVKVSRQTTAIALIQSLGGGWHAPK